MSKYDVYERLSKCEAICKMLRSQMEDTLQKSYDQAIDEHNERDAASICRQIRNHLLEDSDQHMLADRPYSEDWATYRKALREIPEQEGFPFEVVFPEKPEE